MFKFNVSNTIARIALISACALSTQAFAAVASADAGNAPAAKACPQLAQQLQNALGKVASEQSKPEQMQVKFRVTPQGVQSLGTSGSPSLPTSFAVRRAVAQLQCDTQAYAGKEFAIALNLNPTR